jgi:hypothetical protein
LPPSRSKCTGVRVDLAGDVFLPADQVIEATVVADDCQALGVTTAVRIIDTVADVAQGIRSPAFLRRPGWRARVGGLGCHSRRRWFGAAGVDIQLLGVAPAGLLGKHDNAVRAGALVYFAFCMRCSRRQQQNPGDCEPVWNTSHVPSPDRDRANYTAWRLPIKARRGNGMGESVAAGASPRPSSNEPLFHSIDKCA